MATFRELHHGTAPLLLPNAWDVGSALAFVAAGYQAVGTTSFGVGASAGLPDGGRASRVGTVALVAQLRNLSVHVTADIEVDAADFAARIAAVKQRNPDIFVNARVDNFWFSQQPSVDAVLARAQAYAEAGADGIFVPGLAAPEDIRGITAGTALPVNVLAHPTLTVAELGELGVRRVSSGSHPYRRSVDAAVEAVNSLRDGTPVPPATTYWDMQSRLLAFRTTPSAGS